MSKFHQILIALILCSGTAARADIVLDWNAQALEAVQASGTPPPYVARNLAMLHVAVYNAVEGIAGDHQLFANGAYAGPGAGPMGASIEAAATMAAYTVMTNLYPALSGSFESLYNTHVAALGVSQATTDGLAWGSTVASGVLDWRSTDGASIAGATPYTPVGQPGYWQPTAPGYASPLLPGWGNVSTFAIPSTAGFQPAGLPGPTRADFLASTQYANELNQVKEIGSLTSLTRTADQSEIAVFWAAGGGTVTPPGQWNQIGQTVAASAGLTLQDNARVFAALNVAMADAGIVSWDAKYGEDLWRPITAIWEAENDGNPLTEADLAWLPFITTPPFPEYTSGHSSFSGAAMTVLADFFGDDTAFSYGTDIDGDGIIDITRDFTSFTEAGEEAGMSRIYGGIHFMSGNIDGRDSGEGVGLHTMETQFNAVPEPGSALLVGVALLSAMGRRRGSRSAR